MRHALAITLALLAPPAFAACPLATGDVAPGVVTPGAVARWSPQGDGKVDITDVVASLREAVGLQVEDGALLGGECPSLVGDVAPGTSDPSTQPPTWRPRGDGVVDVADVVTQLRASVGLLQLAPTPRRSAHQLERTQSCEELLAWLQDAATRSFDENGGWGGGWWWTRWGGGPVTTDRGAPDGPAGGSASSWSGTNVQVAGVDEPDLAKTDGRIIATLTGKKLRLLIAWPAEDLGELASLDIEGWPTGLFLDRGRAVVVSQVWSEPAILSPAVADLWSPQGLTKLTVVNVEQPASPRVEREIFVDGWLQASRLVGGRTVLVMYHALRGPALPPWTGDDASWRQAVHDAIAASDVEDWLPSIVDLRHAAGGTTVNRRFAVACDDVRHPRDVPPAGLVSVLELDAVTPGAFGSAAVVGTASTVMVSQRRAYVTTDRWSPDRPESPTTRIHQFALGGADAQPRYLGAGEVPGTVGTPWALDESGTTLRVATTTRAPDWTPSTNVFVLRTNGTGDLERAGQVTGLAPGETLQAARFLGDRGYLVTFERKDPLFVLDLSDEANPRVTGQLVIPGWSSYLHPLDDAHLIGIGREVDPDTQRQLGMHVSVFDVGDPAAPALASKLVEPIGWNGSEAEWDHHAFAYHAPLRTLAVPVSTWEYHDCGDCDAEPYWAMEHRVFVYRVTPEEVSRTGAIGMMDGISTGRPEATWCGGFRRVIFLDDHAVALGETGAVAARVGDRVETVSLVIYDGACPGGPDPGPGSTGGGTVEPGG